MGDMKFILWFQVRWKFHSWSWGTREKRSWLL